MARGSEVSSRKVPDDFLDRTMIWALLRCPRARKGMGGLNQRSDTKQSEVAEQSIVACYSRI
jgi:hypothetical protein